MLECANCGAVGESFFSTNYFGELVCDLCGTQSFLQSRNETQDAEDMGMDMTRVATTLRATRRRRREPGVQRKTKRARKMATDVTLLDCLVATQSVLEHQVQALMQRVDGFPPEFPRVVRDLWFQLLETWEAKSDRPLLRCFTEFFIRRKAMHGDGEDDALDPAMTRDLLAQWDAEQSAGEGGAVEGEEDDEDGPDTKREDIKVEVAEPNLKNPNLSDKVRTLAYARVLRRFCIVDLLALLQLAARVLNLPLLPSDFSHWVVSGALPFHNLLDTCCDPDARARIADVAVFFDSSLRRHKISAPKIAYHAHYLQYHLELRLPPLNASLVAYAMCDALGLPPVVFRNFQWITALLNATGALPEKMVLQRIKDPVKKRQTIDGAALLDSGVGIAAHLVVATKLSPNWFDWIFERVDQDTTTDDSTPDTEEKRAREAFADGVDQLPRRYLPAFVAFCEQSVIDSQRSGVPPAFAEHVEQLADMERAAARGHDELKRGDGLRQHEVVTYPPEYEDGVITENDQDIEARLAQLKQAAAAESSVDGIGGEADGATNDSTGAEDAYFYPIYEGLPFYYHKDMHGVYERLLDLVCQHIDSPLSIVLRTVQDIDASIRPLFDQFVNKDSGYWLYASVAEASQG